MNSPDREKVIYRQYSDYVGNQDLEQLGGWGDGSPKKIKENLNMKQA
jgi:hypothetical protein